jgi:PilZ domain
MEANMRDPDIEPAERRHCERRNVERTVGLVVKSDSKATYQEAVTINLCEHGAKVGGDIELSPGQSIDLILRAATTEAVPAKVVWARRADGYSEAGLRFMMEPTTLANTLLAGGLA